jgi:nucleotide-binding universal stress UspA family protein
MRLLLATGGSSHSNAALRVAAQFAGSTGAALTVLTVVRDESRRPRAEAVQARARARLGSAGVPLDWLIRIGQPVAEIVQEARAGLYDLVIVGQRPASRGWRRRLLATSTAMQVAERAPCPVVIAKGRARPIKRILLCDGGDYRPSILSRFTAQLAELLEGEEDITVLHVMSQIPAMPGIPGSQLRASAEELMEEKAPEGEILERDLRVLDRPGIHARAMVRHGLVVDEIVAEAQAGDYDLVVIGAHEIEGWQHLLLDDLAAKIIAQLDRPVIVVR